MAQFYPLQVNKWLQHNIQDSGHLRFLLVTFGHLLFTFRVPSAIGLFLCLNQFDSFDHNVLFQSERELNSDDIVFTSLMIFWSFVALLGFCTMGEILTQQFDQFYDELCNQNWYSFPVELQQMLVMFIRIAQKSVTIHGSATTLYRLQAFKEASIFGIQILRLFWNRFLSWKPIFFLHSDVWQGILLLHDHSQNWRINLIFALFIFITKNFVNSSW